MKKLTRKGATAELAVDAALRELGVRRDEVEVEIIDPGKKGFLGFGAKDAEVLVTVKKPAEPAVEKAADTLVEEELKEEARPAEEIVQPAASVLKEAEVPAKQAEPVARVQAEETVEELDSKGVSDEAAIKETIRYLMDIAAGMGIDDLDVQYETDGKYISLQLESSKAAFLIGKRGQTLNALQQLCQLVLNKYANNFKVIRLDVGDYRKRREQSLEQLADRMADQAIRTGRKVQLEPMPSHERKVIHNALSNRFDIETYSEGTDPNRYLVIEPVR